MCGIAGIWNLDGSRLNKEKLVRFTDSIIERGPDGSGYELYDNETLGLGHRRLSILDLTDAGHQPMSYLDGRYHMTYNGEVFNFGELRIELEQKGYTFRSDTDSEVVMAAFDAWGPECLNRFNGMWAFAIWDNSEKTLFMARDRFGIKPFYYYHQPGKLLAFASETRAFKKLDGFQREFDSQMVQLRSQEIRIHGSGYSIYKDIFCVMPGHFALVRRDGNIKQQRWWHIEENLWKDVPKNFKEQAEQYYDLFEDSCRLRLISDVRIATALSGGLDSSSVYSVVNAVLNKGKMDRVPGDSQTAVVVTFPGLEDDEREYAEKAIRFTGGNAIFLPQEYPNLPEQVVNDTIMFDSLNRSPITAVSGIYKGMKERGIKVSLDGHGVDEMLYGYRDMLYNLFNFYYKQRMFKKANMVRNIIVPTYPEQEQPRVLENLNTLVREIRSPFATVKSILKGIIGTQKIDRSLYQISESFEPIGQPYDFRHLSYPDQIIYNETFVETLPTIFRNFDLAGMMNSVEIRMPFMDWRLVTYLFSLPIESKIGYGFNKLILREAMKGRMAEEIRTRRLKIGINSPITSWMNNELREWAFDMFSSSDFRNSEFTNVRLIDEILNIPKDNPISTQEIESAWKMLNLFIIK